jgi:polyhydroxyalkanoate synthesis repressor PhaR
LNEPTGVRAAETMTMSVMGYAPSNGESLGQKRSLGRPYRTSAKRIPSQAAAISRRKQRLCLALRRGKAEFALRPGLRGRERRQCGEPRDGDVNVADASGQAPNEDGAEAGGVTVVIKKYANRRLYNTAASTYVTLDHLSEMVREGVDFVVLDAKTGDDITRSVLTQIIFEQESRGQNLLPVQFLRRLIRFYGDQMQGFLPPYLEMSMESFAKTQEKMRENMSRAFGATTPMAAFEEQAQRNMALFQQALTMWSPFAQGAQGMPFQPGNTGAATSDDADKDEQLAELRRQMETMQKQLNAMSRDKG